MSRFGTELQTAFLLWVSTIPRMTRSEYLTTCHVAYSATCIEGAGKLNPAHFYGYALLMPNPALCDSKEIVSE